MPEELNREIAETLVSPESGRPTKTRWGNSLIRAVSGARRTDASSGIRLFEGVDAGRVALGRSARSQRSG